MTRTLRTCALTGLTVIASVLLVTGRQARPDSHTLQQAVDLIESKGDLAAALPLLEQAAKSAERPVAARALLYLGQAVERTDAARARSIYERIEREFSDQQDVAVQARTRLAALPMPSPREATDVSTRHVWTVPIQSRFARTISPDERLVAFTSAENGVSIHDLRTNETRRLTPEPASGVSESEDYPAFSRDGHQVAYLWSSRGRESELRTVRVEPGSQPQTLYRNEDIGELYPYDWTADGRLIAVEVVRRDGTIQIGLVSVPGGTLTVLKSMEWRLTGQMAFSPDGRYLAVDLPETEATRTRDVYVLAVDGSREVTVVEDPAMDVLIGWNPDGRQIVFGSDRSGLGGIWSVAVESGRVAGAPTLLKADVPVMSPVGISTTGRLYYRTRAIPREKVRIADLDLTSHTVSGLAYVDDTRTHTTHTADFSRDGRLIAYISQDFTVAGELAAARNRITIRALDTRQIQRQLRLEPELEIITSLRWAPDARSFAVSGRSLRGRYGVFVVDATTGATRTIAQGDPGPAMVGAPAWSADSARVYYLRRSEPRSVERAVIEHDLATGAERELYRRNPLSRLESSPDGRFLAASGSGMPASGKENALILISTADGSTREVLPSGAQQVFVVGWVPDNSSVLVVRESPNAPGELLRVPIDGSTPGRFAESLLEARVHPDGRRIAFDERQSTNMPAVEEIWVLESILAATTARR